MTPYLLIIFAATIWGILNAWVKPLRDQGLSAGVLSLAASLIGGVCIVPMLMVRGFDMRIFAGDTISLVFVDGLLEGLNVLAFCIAVSYYTTTARASIMKYLAPSLLVFVFAPIILHESASFSVLSVAALGFIGICCMPMKGEEEGRFYQHKKGMFIGFIAAIFFGCLMAVEHKLGKFDPYSVMFCKMIIRAGVFAAFIIIVKRERMWPKKEHWFRIAVFGFAIAVSVVCFFVGNSELSEGSRAGVLTYLDLVVAVVLSLARGEEKFQKRITLGGLLILASGVLVTILR